ncbi:Sodium- and chloride-dependent glycine transporter 2 [Sarcoptes scabiei]|nr:Sodium- and chloride-dependent glycine transporter 2 [Sarcoptes scabiei]
MDFYLLRTLSWSEKSWKSFLFHCFLSLRNDNRIADQGIQLEGSSDGIAHYLRPNFEKLTDINVWSDAATQIFYSLSICMGGVINLASYNSFYNNLFNDSILIVICNSLTSIYAGFAIFSVIGFMAKEMGSTIEEAADQGVGLAFVAYPAALAHLPFPSIWSIIFFLMIITLGFGSQMTIVETIVSTIVDFWPKKFQKHKPIVLGGVCLILFLSGIPLCTGAGIYILQLMDTYSVPYSAFFIAIAELIAIFWVYGFDNYLNNLFKMLGFHIWPLSYWKVMFKFICPTIISCLLFIVIVKHEPLVYNDYIFPQYTEYIGWTMTFSSALMMPLFASIEFWKVYVDGRKTLKDILRPEVNFEDPSKRKKIKETPKSIDTLKKNFNENSFIIGEDNPGYVEDEKLNPKPNNLKDSSIEIKMNGNRLLNLSSLSTWTFGDSQEYPIDRKLSSSPSLQNVFQSN